MVQLNQISNSIEYIKTFDSHIMSDHPAVVTPSLPNYASPLVTRERFAEMVGLPVGVIVGWINKGYLPTVSDFGKYSLVNLELLRKQCLAKEFQ